MQPIEIVPRAKITVSEVAQIKLLELREKEGLDDSSFFRIGIKSGGCSGFKYELGFSNIINEDDLVFTQQPTGLRAVVDKQSFEFLKNSTVGYQETLMKSGFIIDNPNKTRDCGCGKSFS